MTATIHKIVPVATIRLMRLMVSSVIIVLHNAVGFVYVAVILDAWSRRVVGYAISRSIDARLTIAFRETTGR
jgi:hypothetical protein